MPLHYIVKRGENAAFSYDASPPWRGEIIISIGGEEEREGECGVHGQRLLATIMQMGEGRGIARLSLLFIDRKLGVLLGL